MTTTLAVIQPNPIQQCHRCGHCCERVSIPYSPRELRERFEADQPYSVEEGTERRDIRVIYPMLKDKCQGKLQWGEKGDEDYSVRFVYGPCANLSYEEKDGRRLAKCALHGKDEKPYMCSGYPFYGGFVPYNEPNPGYIPGCGYNLDPGAYRTEWKIEDYLRQPDEDEL